MNLPNSPLHVVIDASVLVGLCAKEPHKYPQIMAALQTYANSSSQLYAPHLIVMETLYVLCKKQQDSILTPAEHAAAVNSLHSMMTVIQPPPNGDASLIVRAEQIRQGYGCSHSADGFYIALAEELAALGPTELLTFDVGQSRQAASVPAFTVVLL